MLHPPLLLPASLLRLLLRASMTQYLLLETNHSLQPSQARIQPVPDVMALSVLLDQHLPTFSTNWSIEWQCIPLPHQKEIAVIARLNVAQTHREGLGSGTDISSARSQALQDVFRAFGIDTTPLWVDYDAEEGANIHDLLDEWTQELHEALTAFNTNTAQTTAKTENADPSDPMETAKFHINELLEKLRESGKGKEALTILATKGYGKTIEESRMVYKQLKGILDK